MAPNDVSWHLCDKHGDKLEAGRSHAPPVGLREEGPHVVLLLGHFGLLRDRALVACETSTSTATLLSGGCRLSSLAAFRRVNHRGSLRGCLRVSFRLLFLLFFLLCLFRFLSVLPRASKIEHIEELGSKLVLLFGRPCLNELKAVSKRKKD